MQSTYMAKPQGIERNWYVIDATGKPLGRLASEVAKILTGKNKPIYTPHVDTGDYCIIINADKVVLTGKKINQKLYRHYSGYPGGMKETPYKEMLVKKPEFVIFEAVRGMLPKNRLGRKMIKKLKIYRGSEHKHEAQKPQPLELHL
ncbi:MAG: 50S ribosomal protein L13 [Thermoanaerobacteraceae bacterium]|nr:50S ribosomal protein L13 [Thermoanaerobacteraceae bacterium]